MFVKFKYQVYHDENTNYSVCEYKDIETGKCIKCTGTDLPTFKNVTYEFTVETYKTDKYGESYRVIAWQEQINKVEEDIINYLSCGLFAGISKKTAQKIYDCFKEDTLDVLDNDINKLIDVPGIGKKTVAKIKQSYIEKRASREIAQQLIKYGISTNSINRIYREYGADALTVINERPYELCKIKGITFPVADKIAEDRKFRSDSYERVKAASNYILANDMLNGNVCMEKNDYGHMLIKILNTPYITRDNVVNYVVAMIKDGTIKYNKRISSEKITEFIYYPNTYYAERNIADNILRLISCKKRKVDNMDELIRKYAGSISLDNSQIEAIKLGITEPIYIITGGPGTGKTTILKIIAQINQELNDGEDNNIFLSPTGRAARRITESTGYPANTIHSGIGLNIIDDERFVGDGFTNEKKIEDARVIVDESSMIDLWTMDGLLRNIENSSLGLIGDIDQLPSVRCGSILRDLIDCGKIPCVKLEHFHRQADDALDICINAQNIKNGIHSLKTGKDFEIIESLSLEDAEKKIVDAALREISIYGLDNVKVLCPFKKGSCGVYNVNNILQANINKNVGKELKIMNNMAIRVGDPVMQLRNIEDVSNGDTGYVTMITADEVHVSFQTTSDEPMVYSYNDAKEQLTLAYATTVHKSQGAEYDSIIMALTPEHGIMKKRNILYTGITRGRHKVTLIGTDKSFNDAIDNNMIEDRHSMLSVLINPEMNKDTAKVVILPKKTVYKQLSLI